MKECPNCHELIGDSVKICFNCHYDFSLKRVADSSRIAEERKNEELRIQQYHENKKQKEEIKRRQLSYLNSEYEYETVVINDLITGEIDSDKLQKTLESYALNGWRLHSVFTNEVGKNSGSSFTSFLGVSINATIDQTILIFERCIKG